MKKTFKREVAVALLLVMCWCMYSDQVDMLEIVVWPFITFAAAAFGIDAFAKQVQR